MIKRNDIKLLGVILLVAVIAIIIINLVKTDGSQVVITIDGKEYETLPLNVNKTVTVQVDKDHYNVVKVQDGKVSMSEANCPDKLCVKHNKIHYNGETIVCLPHKVVLEIKNGKDNDVDITAQ